MAPLSTALALGIVAVSLAAQASAQAAPLDPSAGYTATRSRPVTHDVELTAVVTAPAGTKRLRVWVPIPPSDAAQSVESSAFETYPETIAPELTTEPVFGNRFAYFEFRDPQGAQMVRHRLRITTHELRWNVKSVKVMSAGPWPASFEPYLRSESQAVVVGDEVKKLARDVAPRRGDALGDLRGVMDWIQQNLRYDHAEASLQASSQWALQKRAGHCSDYHSLCSAMTRALGYPARVTYGISMLPKASPSHCKAEVFLPPYGWVSFDLSETQKLCEKITQDSALEPGRRAALVEAAKRRLLTGYRENLWFLQTRGTDYDLAPKAARKVAVVRTIYAEADGRALPEPDPSDPHKREFAWMTLHRFLPTGEGARQFTDVATLDEFLKPQK